MKTSDAITNLAGLLTRHRDTPDKVLYRQWADARWQDYTARDMLQLAARWQQAFRQRGFEKGDRVALCLKNGVDWVAVDMAALGMGLVVVPLYVNDNAENIAWCLAHSESRLLVLEGVRMSDALRRTGNRLPSIVCLRAEPGDGVETVEQWLPAEASEFEVQPMQRDTLATIVYTSGTTGRPKGVKLSHRNILANAEAGMKMVAIRGDDLLLSVLPLSHMFERTCGYYAPLQVGATVAYSRGIQQMAEDLQAQRPTVLIAVPRLFERFLARIEQSLAQSLVKRLLFHRTVKLGWRCFQGAAGGWERAFYGRLKPLVAAPVLTRLGGRLRFSAVGGAALEHRVAETFIGLGLTLIQGYGLTEASPIVAGNREDDNDPFSVGRPLAGLEIRVNEQHELLVRGPSVMLGYWRNPEATAAMIDAEGWLNTGDQVDIRNGRVYIKGRTKEIIVLSNGEKLPTAEVEVAILEDPLFEQVMLAGEGRAFPILLAVTQETDEKKLLRRANEQLKQFPRYVRLRRVIAFKDPWTLEEGLLTPTMKVKRAVLHERFRKEIDAAYRTVVA